jgi:diacylglycerol kinase family enzyme
VSRTVTGGAGGLVAVVVNGPRIRDAEGLRRACERAAATAGWQPPLILATTSGDPGSGAARSALEAGAGLVVVVGGDGTVRACAEVLAAADVPMAIIPAGSANLTARALGIPARLPAALEVAFGGRDRRIDLGAADGAVFAAMAGIGLDAVVVAAAHRIAKRLAGWSAYAVAATGQLLRRPDTFTIRLDDGEPMTRRAHCVTVGNSGALPGGFAIMPDAVLDDGWLDVLVLAPRGAFGWADVGYRVALGSHRDDAQLQRYRARKVEILAADRELPRQIDGELASPSRALAARVLPGALLVRVPAEPARGEQRSG